jgi:hypothetical protein
MAVTRRICLCVPAVAPSRLNAQATQKPSMTIRQWTVTGVYKELG